MSPIAEREGWVDVDGGSVWYRLVGDGTDSVPLVSLHGGPGYPSASLRPLQAIGTDRPVLLYDQLGCGNSDRPEDERLWTVERSVAELSDLIEHLDFDAVDLLGHSWGTMLAVDFYLFDPAVVRSMVLASPALSASRWSDDCDRLISLMPEELRAIHDNPDASEDEIEHLNTEFKKRYIFRGAEEHEARKAAGGGFGTAVYDAMWGPNEFTPTGVLKDYDRTGDLGRIGVPVLYTCGRYDEATPESTQYYASLTPGARVKVFEDSAHFAHLEQTDEFISEVNRFFDSI